MLRQQIVDYIQDEFMGPSRGHPHVMPFVKDYLPYQHLITGMLFPQQSEVSPDHLVSQDESRVDNRDDPLSLSITYLTASVGMSINIPKSSTRIRIAISASMYEVEKELEDDKEVKKWKRRDLSEFSEFVELKNHQFKIFEDKASLDIRVHGGGKDKLVTFTIINNAKKSNERGKSKQEDILCRVAMDCWLEDENILPYPKIFRSTMDDEEAEQQILYKDEHIYAVGHACSVEWGTQDENVNLNKTSLSFLPVGITKGSKSSIEEINNSNAISMEYLANPNNLDKIPESLVEFSSHYKKWVEKTIIELNDLSKYSEDSSSYFEINITHKKTIEKLIYKLEEALTRIDTGIEFLKSNPDALKAFQLANLAMLMQMVHGIRYDQILDSNEKLDYKFFQKDHAHVEEFNEIDYLNLNKLFGDEYRSFEWYPFQLAYFLTTCKSVVTPEDAYRETVDLIWFATGGGKTEAYLFVAAFLIFFNKITKENHDGVEVIMRYTLRLLTQDQFVRSARFITSCEKIRRLNANLLGDNKITIGLWIGGDSSPNKYIGAIEQYDKLVANPEPDCKSPFIIGSCPWCNTNLVPKKKNNTTHYGFKATEINFHINCPSSSCEFNEGLPIQIVDSAIYEKPPTFLLGTVDKFVQLAHIAESGSVFTHSNGNSVNLIIQDELHLISGPLGTITGAVEAAFDTLLQFNQAKPKYMAATATIRGARNQVQKLYARDVSIFPPSGITHEDRFFSKINPTDPGRMYIGVMSQGHTSVSTRVRIAAALSQAVEEIDAPNKEKDGYHTLMIYHNTKNEKSKTKTLGVQDIPERVHQIASINNKYESANNYARIFKESGVEELSSEISTEKLFDIRKRLELERGNDDCIDLVAATSIIQVGIDIPRLALMQVTGQPKTSSEFIQATSRVGRGKNPGLVVVNYMATNPRDRSHYEQFNGYISSVNRYVEPTSVTPAAEPSLKRTLPTCLLILAKHLLDLSNNLDAKKFNYSSNNKAKVVFDSFEERLIKADPSEAKNIKKNIKKYLEDWEAYAIKHNQFHYHARFNGGSDSIVFLTKDYGDPRNKAYWEILNTMRFVDTEVGIKVI